MSTRAGERFAGTTPVSELLAWLDENEPSVGRDQFFRAYRAWSLAMLGRFEEARAILSVARAEQAERGGGILLANLTVFESASVELLADDPVAAAVFAEEGFRLHEELGEQGFLAAAAGIQAEVHYALDRLDEASSWADRAAKLGTRADIGKELTWRPVKAKVLARRGEHEAAERLIRETVTMCDRTEALDAQAAVYAALGEVLSMAGRPQEAAEAFEQSVARYERKGNIVMAGRTRGRLETVRS
jgi:tetratricopeptide (TPR) repeat protein